MAKPPMFQGKYIYNLRSIFCGVQGQHDQIVSSARDFLNQNKPGIFVVGGTNLTGKTTLKKRIQEEGGLTKYSFLKDDKNPPPEKCYVEKIMEFSDESGKPKNIKPEDLYEHDGGTTKLIPKALSIGIKTIFLPEIWAGHEQALKLIRDEFVRKHDCKVIIDAVSSGKGIGFFDGEANNHFIQESLSKVFKPEELNLHLLDFDRHTLQEGVRILAGRQDFSDFKTNITIFSRDQRELLDEARKHSNLDSVLAKMLDLPINGDVERR